MAMGKTRADGRDPDQLRPVQIHSNYLESAPGAVLIEMGKTRVICTVALEDRVPPFLVGTGKGWLTAEYGMLPGSSPKRIARETSTGKVNSRGREIQRLIGRALRATVVPCTTSAPSAPARVLSPPSTARPGSSVGRPALCTRIA